MLGSFLPADADLCLCNTAVLCGQRLVVGGGDGQAWNPHFGCALSMCMYGLCMSGVVSKASIDVILCTHISLKFKCQL